DHLGKRLAMIAGVVVTVILVMGLLRGEPLGEIVLTAVALAVAAIPEGLPAVVTVTLAIGMYRMTRRGAIVKRMAAVETLGSTTVICSDKTGTLTMNQMTARSLYFAGRRFAVSGEGYQSQGEIRAEDGGTLPGGLNELLTPAVLCNDSRLNGGRLIGDPTEGALLALAAKAGLPDQREDLPRLAELPFESERRFMATFHPQGKDIGICLKGAPDVLIERCGAIFGPEGEIPLDAAARAVLAAEIEVMAGRALRVLAVARDCRPAEGFSTDDLMSHIEDLTLVGLIGIMDPPRPEAQAAIAACHQAGIAVKMITGDHGVTAAAIAAELGLHGEVVTGAELERMDQPALASRIDAIVVFARVSPEHKVRIVEALRTAGHVVAMTG
ncbi:MAG: HAD-IC family P-type ATPase, partial [Rhodospirillales bacterium]|nr:HAD-IC family P-type ATPase [Rhodospirillales bacterium]